MTYQELLLLLSGAVAARAAVAAGRAFSGARFNRRLRADAARLPMHAPFYDVSDGVPVLLLPVLDERDVRVERSVSTSR